MGAEFDKAFTTSQKLNKSLTNEELLEVMTKPYTDILTVTRWLTFD